MSGKNKYRRNRLGEFLKFCRENPSFTVGFVIMCVIFILGVFAPVFAPHDPALADPDKMLMKPFTDWAYPLGTDYIGRCLLSRMIYGIRMSFIISLSAEAITLILGFTVGLLAGMFYPGPIDTVLMRIVDVQLGFPFIVLVIILIGLFGSSIPSLIVVLALSTWAPYARNIRGSVMIEKDMDYINAAKLMGASNTRIAFKYLLRNLIPSTLPVIPMDISACIATESLLSYMGLGVQPPRISLGNIMADGKNYIATHWWITAMTGILIAIMAIALTMIGDALHKKFDPTLSR